MDIWDRDWGLVVFGIEDCRLVLGIGIGILIGDWDLGSEFKDLDMGLGQEIGNGDWNWRLGIRPGYWDCDF